MTISGVRSPLKSHSSDILLQLCNRRRGSGRTEGSTAPGKFRSKTISIWLMGL